MSHAGDKPRSRRELVAGLIGESSSGPERHQLGALLELEYLAQYVYSLASASSFVSAAGQALARQLHGQEAAHAAALSQLTGALASAAPSFSTTAAESALSSHGLVVRFSALHTERAWFTLLEGLESALEGAYYKALGHLVSPAAVSLATRIFASEAQHSTLLFSLRNPQNIGLDVSEGLVTGSAGQPAVATGS